MLRQSHPKLDVFEFVSTMTTANQVLGNSSSLCRRQLVMTVGRKPIPNVSGKHVITLLLAPLANRASIDYPDTTSRLRCPSRFANVLCARFNRDATVPFEHPSTSAISSYESPSMYFKRIGSRIFGFRVLIASFTESAISFCA